MILGMVRSNLFVTGFQLLSRIAVTWAITYSVPDVSISANPKDRPPFGFAEHCCQTYLLI